MPWQIESFFCFLFLQQDSRIRRNHHGPFCPFGPLPSQDDLQADNDDYRLPCPYGKYDSIQGQLFGHRHMILCCRHKLQSHLFRRIFLQFFHKTRIFGETILPYFRLDYDALCNIWFLKKYISQSVTNNRLLQYPLPWLELL